MLTGACVRVCVWVCACTCGLIRSAGSSRGLRARWSETMDWKSTGGTWRGLGTAGKCLLSRLLFWTKVSKVTLRLGPRAVAGVTGMFDEGLGASQGLGLLPKLTLPLIHLV